MNARLLAIAARIMLNYHVSIYLWRGEMHTIPDTIRELLLATGVLQFDEDHQLHFIGLTLSESQFFLDYTKMNPQEREPSKELILSQLRHRHIQARMQHCFQLMK
jgi:hypothetical protein